jgi:hypothetical protein
VAAPALHHRPAIVATGRLKFGLSTGLFIVLQIGSSIYYGILLAMLLTLAGAVQLVRSSPRSG